MAKGQQSQEQTSLEAVESKGGVPAEIQAMLNNEVNNALEGIDPRPPVIKINKDLQAFVLPDGTTAKTLTGVIVFHHKARGYWETEGQKIPTCSSIDGKGGAGDPGGKCRICSLGGEHAWGSGKGGHGKACKEMRWIYLMQEDDAIPSKISLPPTSLSKFDSFITALIQKKIAPIQKIVKLSLEVGESRGFKFSALAQPEVVGSVDFKKIPKLIALRDRAVKAAKEAGIESDDYYSDNGEEVVSEAEEQVY